MNRKKTADTQLFDHYRGTIRSTKGGWFPGRGVFCHGHNMMEDLVGICSFFQVLILNATGRLVERSLADWFEATYICLSWPDPRIWCNGIGALGGTLRTSVVAATTAGILAGDSKAYGQGTLSAGVRFIQQALVNYKNGLSPEEIIKNECSIRGGKPDIVGFARPLAKGDERIDAMERVTKALDFEIGEHLQLAYQIEQVLLSKYNESMNINGYASAFLSDQGFGPEEVYRIYSILVTSGVTACYIDAVERPPETFLPLRCTDIDYQGPPPRKVPNR